jgi:hypothetical protein
MRTLSIAIILALIACAGAPASVSIVDPTSREVRGVMSRDEVARFHGILRRMTPSEGWAMTPAPWGEVIVATWDDSPPRIFRFTATVLRENRADPWSGKLAGPDGAPSRDVQDYDLEFDDEEWIRGIMSRILGPTKVKQYLPVDHPGARLP